ncbi:MAG: hypothetical protein NUV65_06920 [Candidatus Roizmanbacteria bacterium]|nr:hypothetical protein [Candidatus Roizmanbacteria bacterium]
MHYIVQNDTSTPQTPARTHEHPTKHTKRYTGHPETILRPSDLPSSECPIKINIQAATELYFDDLEARVHAAFQKTTNHNKA